jgi:hypothetical protein
LQWYQVLVETTATRVDKSIVRADPGPPGQAPDEVAPVALNNEDTFPHMPGKRCRNVADDGEEPSPQERRLPKRTRPTELVAQTSHQCPTDVQSLGALPQVSIPVQKHLGAVRFVLPPHNRGKDVCLSGSDLHSQYHGCKRTLHAVPVHTPFSDQTPLLDVTQQYYPMLPGRRNAIDDSFRQPQATRSAASQQQLDAVGALRKDGTEYQGDEDLLYQSPRAGPSKHPDSHQFMSGAPLEEVPKNAAPESHSDLRRPSAYLRSICPLCFGGAKPDLEHSP